MTLRAASFCAGVLLLAVAWTGPVADWAHHDFRGHMLQHLLVGMLAPIALALGAPVSFLLRRLPRTWARRLGRVLRSRPAHVLADPWLALTLSTGGMVALYCTPLHHQAPAPLVHAHFLLSGYLFAWVIAGRDPAPGRPSVPARLVVLGVAIAVHAGLSQAMYAGWVHVPVPEEQRRGAAAIMYYGGDLAELLLALALVGTWRLRRLEGLVLPDVPGAGVVPEAARAVDVRFAAGAPHEAVPLPRRHPF
ncbi:cytochrome c oxidase assembly protein [Nonomuraea sp. NN258]|uniref:cytochrome c oxidase assembly protein n=1 Tax=Nonomuraea antri TaxID=2730852 RepID=UPI001567CBB9|nr:cytochrome c oxidase assembly protein [Nonomuraea antri]NRQ31460.1 cytochrome c oxidase assembly protein [Nonomuraea antri]